MTRPPPLFHFRPRRPFAFHACARRQHFSSNSPHATGAPALFCRPNPWIILMSVVVLFPLSLLRDLSALAFGSVVGNAGTLFTAMFTLFRLADGSYAPGGKFHTAIAEVRTLRARSQAAAAVCGRLCPTNVAFHPHG